MSTDRTRPYRGGDVPFGHRLDGRGELVPDAAEQAALGEARLLRAYGLSLRETAARLRGMGHRVSHVALRRALGEADKSANLPVYPQTDAAGRTASIEAKSANLPVYPQPDARAANWPVLAAVALAALGLALALTQPARAQGACGAIRDADKRQACIAEAERNPYVCTSVRDWDQREACRRRAQRSR